MVRSSRAQRSGRLACPCVMGWIVETVRFGRVAHGLRCVAGMGARPVPRRSGSPWTKSPRHSSGDASGRVRRGMLASSFAAALLAPGALAGQQGTIVYTYSRQYDFEAPERWEGMIPDAETGSVLLVFGPSASLASSVSDGDDESVGRWSDRRRGMLQRLKARSASRGDLETVHDTWVGYAEGAVVETREFMGRNFLVSGPAPEHAWRLTSEQAEHLGRMVIKAEAEDDSTSVEAWFTPEIPVPGGPASYGGLPGMILVLSVDGGRTQYFATEIALGDVDAELIRVPEDGDRVLREEYEEIVKEKLAELERLYRRRGG